MIVEPKDCIFLGAKLPYVLQIANFNSLEVHSIQDNKCRLFSMEETVMGTWWTMTGRGEYGRLIRLLRFQSQSRNCSSTPELNVPSFLMYHQKQNPKIATKTASP